MRNMTHRSTFDTTARPHRSRPMLRVLPALLLLVAPALAQYSAPVTHSEDCALCHSNAATASAMRDGAGRDVSPHGLWRATMMANSARDPLWRAVMSVEVDATPSRRDEIEATCMRCHAPMASAIGLDDHGTGSVTHLLDCDSSLGRLARDGVSCTICHGMSPDGLGSEATFSGAFRLDPERRMYGPHATPFTRPMRMHVGMTPTHGEHVTSAELCASCHTLETRALAPDGRELDAVLVEQAPYLEWQNSTFGERDVACQSCHVPTSDVDGRRIETRIARNPGGRDFPPVAPRRPYGRHAFVGGNTLVLSMLRDHADELDVDAPAEAFDAIIAATREQLRERTARVSVERFERVGDELALDVRVDNFTGHKFPTAHPTRRAWLRVVARGPDGEPLFVSGGHDDRGRIVDADGEPLPSERRGGPIEAHHDVIRSSRQAATFESKMAGADGAPTHLLLRGTRYLKDDRLLPRGWRADHAEARRTAPVGVDDDEDFVAGSDTVHYAFAAPTGLSIDDVRVEVTLLYQPLGARWADELLAVDTPEVERFAIWYALADPRPEVVATTRIGDP